MNTRKIEILVGVFVALGIAAFLMLALNVANFSFERDQDNYKLTAKFDNIGSLKVRSPVKMGGVVIGRVTMIDIDPEDFVPVVSMQINDRYECAFSDATSISILTSGILGEQYLGVYPIGVSESTRNECLGVQGSTMAQNKFNDEDDLFAIEEQALKDGDAIVDTKSAVVLEELISQFLYRTGGEEE